MTSPFAASGSYFELCLPRCRTSYLDAWTSVYGTCLFIICTHAWYIPTTTTPDIAHTFEISLKWNPSPPCALRALLSSSSTKHSVVIRKSNEIFIEYGYKMLELSRIKCTRFENIYNCGAQQQQWLVEENQETKRETKFWW